MSRKNDKTNRYDRQTLFRDFGTGGQTKLAEGRVLLVGVGGLGSWISEILARAGVGYIRICDNDRVDLTNIHRQAHYTEADAAAGILKTEAAAKRIAEINDGCIVDVFAERITRETIHRAAKGCDLIVDAVDNFETRYLINDFSVKYNIPWVSGGVLEAEGQVMVLIPGKTPCLQCILPPDAEPGAGHVLTLPDSGILGPTVAAIASLQAFEAVKYLSGHPDEVSPYLTKINFWENTVQRMQLANLRQTDRCPCCDQRRFVYL
jgi:adenylyltransferase/sulfurtransferase